MQDYLTVVVDGRSLYLNDVLLELGYYGQPFVVLVDGVKFELSPEGADSYIREYGQDNYNQMVCGMGSLRSMRRIAYETSDEVVRELK